jgi:hypothetical protein
MLPIRGGRAASPVKDMISIDPAVGASAIVWATAAVRAMTAARSHPSGLPPLRPRGCVATHCIACSRAASLASLSSSLVPPSIVTELLLLLPRKAMRSTVATRATSAAIAASTSALAAVSSTIANLAALAVIAAVSTAVCSCSSTVATSASCWCYALEATEC